MSEQVEIDAETPFYVSDWRVDPATGRVSRKDVEHKIEPKAMTVLVCLAKQQGHVLSRESLEKQAWDGVVVGYDSLASAIIKLRKAFGDNSRNPQYIETVPKKGYRLISPVRAAPQSDNGSAIQEIASQETKKTKRNIAAYYKQIIILFIFAVVAFFLMRSGEIIYPENKSKNSQQPVIAVLPFKNLSDDAQQDYFSDGITADLITDLSKISGLSVIARNSVFIFKNTDATIRTVKDELGADYVVEGSIRKLGDQVRISARLIDASNSINIWADRFDGSLNNIFVFQDKVTEQIISSLEINLTEKDRDRLANKYSNSIEAYDHFLRGWQNLWLSSREGMLNAREDFLKAIELDDQFARAYANLALTYVYDHMHGWTNNDELALVKMHEYADKGISIDSKLPQVYWVKGFADIFSHNYQLSLKHAQMAIDLDPGFADGYGLLATTLNYAGRPKQADKIMQKAMRLNPKYPAIYNVIHGEIFFNMHDYPNAIENFVFALDVNPESEESRIWLAAAYAHFGDLEEADWQLEQLKMNGRNLSLQRLEKVIPFKDPEQRKHFIDGLYKAGLTSE
ncbi:MAG TPA: hypothetical protein DDW55_14995 [Gammaproteobacteria bacterium]|nr:hypothetical protein [Gammaproteobacteria bacterium]